MFISIYFYLETTDEEEEVAGMGLAGASRLKLLLQFWQFLTGLDDLNIKRFTQDKTAGLVFVNF